MTDSAKENVHAILSHARELDTITTKDSPTRRDVAVSMSRIKDIVTLINSLGLPRSRKDYLITSFSSDASLAGHYEKFFETKLIDFL